MRNTITNTRLRNLPNRTLGIPDSNKEQQRRQMGLRNRGVHASFSMQKRTVLSQVQAGMSFISHSLVFHCQLTVSLSFNLQELKPTPSSFSDLACSGCLPATHSNWYVHCYLLSFHSFSFPQESNTDNPNTSMHALSTVPSSLSHQEDTVISTTARSNNHVQHLHASPFTWRITTAVITKALSTICHCH